MKKNLAQEIWLTAPDTKRIADALRADGAVVRFVGGIVRDSLIGVLADEVREIDLAIDRKPDQISALLAAADIKPLPIGADHGTIMASLNGVAYEITALRVDVATDGRHAQVAFTQDWLADAQRRDFTINAIYADLDGQIHDLLNGIKDLAEGRVRFIGDPHQRIREDYLRILRFFRFFAGLAQGAADQESLRACGEEKAGIQQLSGERIAVEMLKLLGCLRGAEALRLMAASGILPIVLPQAARVDLYARMRALMQENFITPDPLLLFAALYATAADAQQDAARLKLSNAQKDRLAAMLTPPAIKIVSYLSMREVRRMLYRLGQQAFCDQVWLCWAADDNPRNGIGWRALLAMAESWEKPQFLLTGRMVQAAGVPDGPEIGRVMREVEAWWVDADFIDDEFSIIERLKAVVQATIYVKSRA